MHRIPIRFRIVLTGEVLEVCFDERLSFLQNMEFLNRISEKKIPDFRVYDPYKKIFLDRNIPLKEFHIETFRLFLLFY